MKRTTIDLTADESPPSDAKKAKKSELIFPDGAVRLTYTKFANLGRDQYLTFDDILGDTSSIKKIVLSAYCIDEEWIFGKLRGVPEVLAVSHWERSQGQSGSRAHPFCKNVTMVYPAFRSFPNYGVMHSKLILIFREDTLRVVVSTGNLVEYDYDEVQNAVFLQDLSLDKSKEPKAPVNQFNFELINVLRRFGVTDLGLERFDWVPVKALLLASESGYHFTSGERLLGLSALKSLSARWHQRLGDDTEIEYQCSSLGKYNAKWLSSVYDSCTGKLHVEFKGRFKIVFPTLESVQKSRLGIGAFGTIFCKSKDWLSYSAALKAMFHQCLPTGMEGRPLHSKLMTVWSGRSLVYYYLGSANFTASAWGNLVKDARQILIANFELGVLLDGSDYPLNFPYERPVPVYGPEGSPWTQDVAF